jgi:branched-chain amino acid transport system substrate-binding protein
MVILTAVLTTGALTLTACGSRDDSGDGKDSGK